MDNQYTKITEHYDRNFYLFQRAGFSEVGLPLPDPSVKLSQAEEAVIIPMQMVL